MVIGSNSEDSRLQDNTGPAPKVSGFTAQGSARTLRIPNMI